MNKVDIQRRRYPWFRVQHFPGGYTHCRVFCLDIGNGLRVRGIGNVKGNLAQELPLVGVLVDAIEVDILM